MSLEIFFEGSLEGASRSFAPKFQLARNKKAFIANERAGEGIDRSERAAFYLNRRARGEISDLIRRGKHWRKEEGSE